MERSKVNESLQLCIYSALTILLLLILNPQPAHTQSPLADGMVPKPDWTVCGNFACYTRQEQVKVVRMRAHYEIVFSYAFLLQQKNDLLEEQTAYLKLSLNTAEAERESAKQMLRLQADQHKLATEAAETSHTKRLFLYTGGGIVGGVLIGLLIAAYALE